MNEFLLDPNNVNVHKYQLGNDVSDSLENKDYGLAYTKLHDLIVIVLFNEVKWFDGERYRGEIEDFASYVADRWIGFTLNQKSRFPHVNRWYGFARSRVGKELARWRSHHYDYEDYSKIGHNPNAQELFDRINGYTYDTNREISIVNELDSLRFIFSNQVFDYVIDHYCLYDRYSLYRKNLGISLMLTLKRERLILYKLPIRWISELKFLLQQFIRIYRICLKNGWYLVGD